MSPQSHRDKGEPGPEPSWGRGASLVPANPDPASRPAQGRVGRGEAGWSGWGLAPDPLLCQSQMSRGAVALAEEGMGVGPASWPTLAHPGLCPGTACRGNSGG